MSYQRIIVCSQKTRLRGYPSPNYFQREYLFQESRGWWDLRPRKRERELEDVKKKKNCAVGIVSETMTMSG